MRVAIVAATFLPAVNGVTGSVCRVAEHLLRTGHEPVIVAPGVGPDAHEGVPVVRVPGAPLPFYRALRIGVPGADLRPVLGNIGPDVVHLAAPCVLGAAGAAAARRLDVPSVAVYQTDLAGFAARYHARPLARPVWAWLRHVHGMAARTLAPSSHAEWELERHGIERVARWARGVDLARFSPSHRSAFLRRRLASPDTVLVGYVGRLAREKRVDLLAPLQALPGMHVVVVGDGPARRALQRRMPDATFTGFLAGAELSQAIATLDVFVHTGVDETFCQAVQEALAAGVPVVAPSVGGPVDLVRHGENGLLWPSGRPDLIAPAVASLVRDEALRMRLASRARESVRHRTWAALGEQLVRHYRDVVAGHGEELAA